MTKRTSLDIYEQTIVDALKKIRNGIVLCIIEDKNIDEYIETVHKSVDAYCEHVKQYIREIEERQKHD